MKNRYSFIDFEKGIGTVLVILGHAGIVGFTKVFLYSFHMPLFFFLSGIFLKYDNDAKKFVKKKIFGILVPYLLFSLLLIIKDIIIVIIRKGDLSDIIKTIFGLLFQMRNTYFNGSFWFLPTLFVATLLCGMVEELYLRIKKNRIRIIFAVVFFVAGYLWMFFEKMALIWNLDAAFVAASFMIVGILLKNTILKSYGNISKGKTILIMLIFLICNIFMSIINYRITGRNVDLFWSQLGNPFLYYFSGIFGIGFIIALSYLIKSRILEFIGRNSLLFYCLHHEFVFPILRFLIKPIEGTMYAPFVLTIITCVAIVPLCVFINRFVPILSGKKMLRKRCKNGEV